jgi:glycosyltransferase involved in cell wall biosynthesis
VSLPPKIEQEYLLVTSIPAYLGSDGSVWLDRLWQRDFVAHLNYVRRLTLAAPALPRRPDLDLVRVDPPAGATLRIVPLPKQESMLGALLRLPITTKQLWRAIGDAGIVHSGIAGWPFPLGWVANSIALLRGKQLFLVVESAPWRLTGLGDEGLRHRVRAFVTERLARFFVNRASLTLFTHEAYKQSLLTRPRRRGIVIPASWIDDADVLSPPAAQSAWEAKRASGSVRLLFAARLVPEKGTDLLLRAVAGARVARGALRIDIIGEGSGRKSCEEAARRGGAIALRVLDPLPYGPRFFELLRGYHAALVPSVTDEQPRIVFDAFAQAVAVIGADTPGLSGHVRPEQTGWLVTRGDEEAWAGALERAAKSASELEGMGLAALSEAREMTHSRMHEARWRVLVEELGAA